MGNEAPVGNVMWETTDGLEWREVIPYPVGMSGGVASLAATSDGPFIAGSLVVECCGYPTLWQLANDDSWEPILPDRQVTEGSVNMTGSAVAPNGSIVAVSSYEAQSPDGISCCVIRGVIAISTASFRPAIYDTSPSSPAVERGSPATTAFVEGLTQHVLARGRSIEALLRRRSVAPQWGWAQERRREQAGHLSRSQMARQARPDPAHAAAGPMRTRYGQPPLS
jgi:hypothetical protein